MTTFETDFLKKYNDQIQRIVDTYENGGTTKSGEVKARELVANALAALEEEDWLEMYANLIDLKEEV